MRAAKSELRPQSIDHIGATKYCCREHVTQTLKGTYLPHVEKVKYKDKTCKFCGEKALYQFISLY
ncbi:hypothetical protein HMPREF3291_01740 [Bacillus sp. HMSC76G11]|uniref:CxxH/CxxC protein n=1 Tax=Metabacillus idriensis TaxID=324768 RepID=A0A6I2MDT0_9BACI|nr:hypothetical protein [Metabacillus idriensis]MRX56478.1 hypothetical protein [Metabacillus idriensis]OHR66111.1 hypothetical protein HMPREF3291_01740 [Bacillus sp. HMSC76G11]